MAQVRVGHARFSNEEVCRRGRDIYERIRAEVETEENIGKMISIDIETGDYEIDPTGLQSSRRRHPRHPGAAVCGLRIGYDVSVALGGTVTRTASQ